MRSNLQVIKIIDCCTGGTAMVERMLVYEDMDQVRLFIPADSIDTAVNVYFLAARCNAAKVLRYFLSAGFAVNHQNKNGETALHVAARHNAIEAAKLLLDSGIDMTVRDNDGHTAMFDAKYREHDAVIALLSAAGLIAD